ncbi:hypothetical protein VULLAG_LOCUS20730 [Vulpes lagopus]
MRKEKHMTLEGEHQVHVPNGSLPVIFPPSWTRGSTHFTWRMKAESPSLPTPCIQSSKEVKDRRPQCGKTLELVCFRQLCLEKFKLECCLLGIWLFMDFEDKVLQIHLVLSLEFITGAFCCSPRLDLWFCFVSIILLHRSPTEGSRTRACSIRESCPV